MNNIDINTMVYKRRRPRGKLSLEQKQEVISLYENDFPVSFIAEKFGVSRPTIYNIISESLSSAIESQHLVSQTIYRKQIQALNHERKAAAALKTAYLLDKEMKNEDLKTPIPFNSVKEWVNHAIAQPVQNNPKASEVEETVAKPESDTCEKVEETVAKSEFDTRESSSDDDDIIPPEKLYFAARKWNKIVKNNLEEYREKRDILFSEKTKNETGMCLYFSEDKYLSVCYKPAEVGENGKYGYCVKHKK